MSLLELLALLRKRFVFIVVLTLAVFAASCVYAFFLPNQYTATSTMYILQRNDSSTTDDQSQSQSQSQTQTTTEDEDLVEFRPTTTQVTSGDLNWGGQLSTEMQSLMTSSLVKKQTAENLGLPGLGGYAISLTSAGSSRMLTLSVTGSDPNLTADVANELVVVTAKAAIDIMNIQAINVIDPATAPAALTGPNRKRYMLMGLAAGLLASILLVRVAEMLDTRVRNSEDLEGVVDVPVVGHFPSANSDESGVSNAAKTLLANVRFMGVDEPIRTIAVTSAAPDEGKTFVASRLARAIATSGKTVLLIEGDMRRRSMASTLGVHSDQGVYSVMTGELGLREAIVSTRIPNLYFLDCESSIPTPSDLLNSQSYSRLIAYAKAMFDYVVFDTPPIGAFVDAAVLGSKVDAVLLVVRENFTRKPDVQMAVDQLGKAGANLAGIVMNYCDPGSGGYYSYYYYGYYYGRDGKAKKKSGLFGRARRDAREFGGSSIGGLRGYLDGRAASKASDAPTNVPGNMYVPQTSVHYSPSHSRRSAESEAPVIPMGPVVSEPATSSNLTSISDPSATPASVASDDDYFGGAAPVASAAVFASPAAPATHAAHGNETSDGLTTNFASLAEQIAQSQFQRTAQEGQAQRNPLGKHSHKATPARSSQQVYDGEVDEI